MLRRVEGLPCKVYPLVEDASLREFHRHHVNAGVALIARKVAPYDPERLRWDVDLANAERVRTSTVRGWHRLPVRL